MKKLIHIVLAAVAAVLILPSCSKFEFKKDISYEYDAHFAYIEDVHLEGDRLNFVLAIVSGRTDENGTLISSGACAKLHLACNRFNLYGDYSCYGPYEGGRRLLAGSYTDGTGITGSRISYRRIGDNRETVVPVRDGEVEIEFIAPDAWDIDAELYTDGIEFEFKYSGTVSSPIFGF